VYGSSRLGINTKKVDMLNETEEDLLTSYTGEKLYEMSNHLGNVLTVINDIKAPYLEQDNVLFKATIVSKADYSPFGVQLDERTVSSESYRYGFNGQEKDDEVYGEGNSTTAEFWQYDSRLGRRWNLDPKPNPSISGYACFANSPLMFSDPFGDTLKIINKANTEGDGSHNYVEGQYTYEGHDDLICQAEADLNVLHNSSGDIGRQIVHAASNLIDPKSGNINNLLVYVSTDFANTHYNPNTNSISYAPGYSYALPAQNENQYFEVPSFVAIGHEIGHTLDFRFNLVGEIHGCKPGSIWVHIEGRKPYYESEIFAIHVENQLRAIHSMPLRNQYGGREFQYQGQKMFNDCLYSRVLYKNTSRSLFWTMMLEDGTEVPFDYYPVPKKMQALTWP